jgi:hypothetical protein
VGEEQARIFGGSLLDPSELVWVEYIEFNTIKLDTIRDDFFYQLAQGVQ